MQVLLPPFAFGTIHLKHRYNWCNPATQKLYQPYTIKCSLQVDEAMILRLQFAHSQIATPAYWKIPFVLNEDGHTPYFSEFDIFKTEARQFIIHGLIVSYNTEFNYNDEWEFIATIKTHKMPDFIHYWDVTE